jgi:hypothetical protein
VKTIKLVGNLTTSKIKYLHGEPKGLSNHPDWGNKKLLSSFPQNRIDSPSLGRIGEVPSSTILLVDEDIKLLNKYRLNFHCTTKYFSRYQAKAQLSLFGEQSLP